jgi:tripartite-type tricarboxylate transporter receptor subunit TctC
MHVVKQCFILASLLLGILTTANAADNYPSRPIRILTGYAPGGSSDLSARLIAQKLALRLGSDVIVENRPGGGTILATQVLAKAAPDGYTLMIVDLAFVANPTIHATLPYNTETDFEPIVQAIVYPTVLCVNSSVPASNIKELIEYSKSKDGQLNYASAGNGSLNHLAAELFNRQNGLRQVHVPYQSGAQAVISLLGSFTEIVFTTGPAATGFQDKLKIIAITGDKRLDILPNVKTFGEQGSSFDFTYWHGLVAPKGTDSKILDRINREVNEILKLPDVKERLQQLGGIPVGGSREAFGTVIRNEVALWKRTLPPEIAIKR